MMWLYQTDQLTQRERDFFRRAIEGEFGEIAQYVAPEKTNDQKLEELKAEALAAIKSTDTVELRCLKKGVEFTEPWMVYYQSLLAVVRMDVWVDGSTLPDMPTEYHPGS